MNSLDKDRYIPFFINFSARTSANQTQVTAIANFFKRQSYQISSHVGCHVSINEALFFPPPF